MTYTSNCKNKKLENYLCMHLDYSYIIQNNLLKN